MNKIERDGLIWACLHVMPIIVVLVLGMALGGCGHRDDGMGDLWKGVRHVQNQE